MHKIPAPLHISERLYCCSGTATSKPQANQERCVIGGTLRGHPVVRSGCGPGAGQASRTSATCVCRTSARSAALVRSPGPVPHEPPVSGTARSRSCSCIRNDNGRSGVDVQQRLAVLLLPKHLQRLVQHRMHLPPRTHTRELPPRPRNARGRSGKPVARELSLRCGARFTSLWGSL